MEKSKILNLMNNRKNYNFSGNFENEIVFTDKKYHDELVIKFDPKNEVYSFNEYRLGISAINIETPEELVIEMKRKIIL